MYGGQGTGEIVLLNLTDLVLLLIECMPAASGVRRKAAAALVGVATGSAAATALANAARTDKTIEDMRAGEAAGTDGVPNPSKANANCNYVAKTTTPGECGECSCAQDKVCELMFDKCWRTCMRLLQLCNSSPCNSRRCSSIWLLQFFLQSRK